MAPSGAMGKRRRSSDSGVKFEDSDGGSSVGLFVSERKVDYDSNASDVGSGEDDKDDIGYSEKLENLPHFAAYDPGVQNIKHRLLRIATNAHKILTEDTCDTPEVDKLRDKAKQVLTVPDGERKTIGLVGNAGQGKSSLINTVTDVPRLAKALDNGKSVTYVVMIYQRAADEQRLPFSARIEYFDLLAIGKLLEEAIADWRAFYFDDGKDGWTAEERKYREDRAKTTLSIFKAVFRNMQGFSTMEDAKATLNRICSSNCSPQQRVSFLVDHIEKTMARDFPNRKYEAYHETRTQDELRDWLDPYLMEDDDGDDPVLWSFVRRVVIGVRGSRILDRWSIADLPGITDTHKVRVHATLNHINTCNHLFVFARLGRIVTDPTVQDLAQKYGHAFADKLWIVATKCDENMGSEEVRELAKKFPDLKKAETHWKQTSKSLSISLKALEQSKKKGRNTASSINRLQEIAELKEARKQHDNEFWEKAVNARNKQVVPQIRRENQQHLPPDSQLLVFCVSNTHYEALKVDEPEDAKFHLSAEATGIPGLRSCLLGLAAPPNFQTLLNFINHNFSVFLGGCQLWAGNGLVEGRAELIPVIKSPQKQISAAFSDYLRQIQNDTMAMIIKPLKANQSGYAESAKEVVTKNLQGRHWGTLQAFIRHYGHHHTPSMSASWNELFTKDIRVFLNGIWADFLRAASKSIVELESEARASGLSIMQLLDREEAALSLPTDIFEKSLQARLDGLRQDFSGAVEALIEALRTILLNATVDGPENYFSRATRETYELCQQEKGTGVKARCLGVLMGQLALQAPFVEMFDSIQRAIQQVFQRAIAGLREKIDETFEQIAEDFALMIRDKKESEAEKPVREKIKAWLPSGLAEFEPIKRDLQKVRARYPGEG